jgi:hypothetical protein
MDKQEKHPDAGRVYLSGCGQPCDHLGALVVEDDGSESLNVAVRMKEGQSVPPGSRLAMRDEHGDLRVMYDGRSGPTQVATKGYRDGWSRTFGVN